MKNTNIINKYLAAIAVFLLIAVFAIAKPISAFAQDDTSYGDPIDVSSGDPIDVSYGDPIDVSSGDPIDVSYDNSAPSTGYDTVSYDAVPTSGSEYVSYPSYGYYDGGSVVSSGSFSGGTTYNVTSPYYYPGNETVYTGTYSGGTPYNYYPTNYQYGALTGSCSGAFVNGQNNVTWTGLASGGNGIYSYYWTGSNGLSGTGQYLSQTYPVSGVEGATLTISSNGQSITASCSATVGDPNQVLAYSATNPNLQSVYLSDVPATGAGDVARVVGFISILMLWSAALAYYFLKRKENTEYAFVASSTSGDSNSSAKAFSMELHSDEKAIESIEMFARMNKILLSSEAVKELAKLSRLGKINPEKAIQNMSASDWTAVGESDIQKFV